MNVTLTIKGDFTEGEINCLFRIVKGLEQKNPKRVIEMYLQGTEHMSKAEAEAFIKRVYPGKTDIVFAKSEAEVEP